MTDIDRSGERGARGWLRLPVELAGVMPERNLAVQYKSINEIVRELEGQYACMEDLLALPAQERKECWVKARLAILQAETVTAEESCI